MPHWRISSSSSSGSSRSSSPGSSFGSSVDSLRRSRICRVEFAVHHGIRGQGGPRTPPPPRRLQTHAWPPPLTHPPLVHPLPSWRPPLSVPRRPLLGFRLRLNPLCSPDTPRGRTIRPIPEAQTALLTRPPPPVCRQPSGGDLLSFPDITVIHSLDIGTLLPLAIPPSPPTIGDTQTCH